MRPLRLAILSVATLVSLASVAQAQITNVNDGTSTPIPGAGHDYIKMLNETVNPANGSVSLRIAVPVPRGRGLTIPFSFGYDSNGIWTPDSFGDMINASEYMLLDGWSYSLPLATFSNISVPGGLRGSCLVSTGYVFQDSGGTRHSLPIAFDKTPGNNCGQYPSIPAGKDDFYSAYINASPGFFPDVTSPDGTRFTFNQLCQGPPNTYGSGPGSMEDRNGNVVNFSHQTCGGDFTETDTLGRTLISAPALGATGAVTVSGLSQPYTETWGTTSVNYTPGVTLLSGACGTTFGTETGPISVMTALSLPNGQIYRFSYDPTYGLLNKITYPTGGYVSFAWAPNSNAELGQIPDCLYTYDSPAIAHRYVSFDGVNVALQQDFSYSTVWVSTQWTSKTTTVTTRDLLNLA